MADHRESESSVRQELERVNGEISAHRLSSASFLRARAVVAEHSADGRDAVQAALHREDLPSLGAQTRMLALGLTSLARLNRRRLRLETRLRELGG